MGHRHRRRPPKRLVDDAIALGQANELLELVFGSAGVELEMKSDALESDRRALVDAQSAAKVELSLGTSDPSAQLDPDRRRDGTERDPRAGDERLEQHVARAR